jgi:hypothetical protein
MANKITLEFEVTDKGTLKQVTSDTNKLSKAVKDSSHATDQASNSKNRYSKLEKGSAQLTSNTTKSFAKQAQTIGSGLVPAYATLAANIFAVSAAFGALKRAAGLEQLEAGLIAVGSAAGQNLPYIADQLREITGAAISTQSAMESVALGTSAGFSTTQMEELTRVAKGASLALGRDMEDAMSRLVRGAAKLEPEILDELGIMVRLDDVTRNYAENVGKTVDSLTNFERRMAFTNAIIDQGTDKFGQIAEKIDPNPYNQLAARFSDLTKNVLKLVNTGLGPFLNLIANNTSALIGVVGLFGTSVASKMLPAMYEVTEAAADNAEAMTNLVAVETKSIDLSGELPPKLKEVSGALKDGTATQREYSTAMASVTGKIGQLTATKNKLSKTLSEEQLAQHAVTKELQSYKEIRSQLLPIEAAVNRSEAANYRAVALQAAQQNDFATALRFSKDANIAYKNSLILSTKYTNIFNKGLIATKAALYGVATTTKIVMTTFLRWLPYIGIAVTAFSALKAAWDKFFGKSDIEKQVDEIVKSFEGFKDIEDSLSGTLEKIEALSKEISEADRRAKIYTASLRVQTGVYDQIVSGINKVISAEKTRDLQKLTNAQQEYNRTFENLGGEAAKAAKEGGEAWDFFVNSATVSNQRPLTSLGVDPYEIAESIKAIHAYDKATKELKKAQEQYKKTSAETYKEIGSNLLGSAIAQIESHDNVTEAMSKNLNNIIGYRKILMDESASNKLKEMVLDLMQKDLEAIKQISTELQGMADTARSFDIAFRDSLKVEDEPFANIIGSLNTMVSSIENAKGDSENLNAIFKELPESIQNALGGNPDLEGLKDYVAKWKEVSISIAEAESNAKAFKSAAERIKDTRDLDTDAEALKNYYAELDKSIDAQNKGLREQKNLLQKSLEHSTNKAEIQGKIEALDSEIAANNRERVSEEEKSLAYKLADFELGKEINSIASDLLDIRKDLSDIAKEDLDLQEKAVERELQRAEMARKRATFGTDSDSSERRSYEATEPVNQAQAELEAFEQLASRKLEVAKQELNIKLEQIDLDFELQYLKLEVIRAEAEAAGKTDLVGKIDQVMTKLPALQTATQEAALAGYDNLVAQMQQEKLQLQFNISDAVDSMVTDITSAFEDMDLVEGLSKVFGDLSKVDTPINDILGSLSTFPEIYTESKKTFEDLASVRSKFNETYADQLSTIADKQIKGIDLTKEETTIQKQGAKLTESETRSKISMYAQYGQAVGSTLGAIADQQDTSTKEGFEKAKKMQMGAAVINTAAAVMNAMANIPAPANIPAAAAAAATGAAQIAQISSTEFGDSGEVSASTGSMSAGFSVGGKSVQSTVLGSDDFSESYAKTDELLKEIHAKEYYQLRAISDGIDNLNSGVKGLNLSLVRDIPEWGESQRGSTLSEYYSEAGMGSGWYTYGAHVTSEDITLQDVLAGKPIPLNLETTARQTKSSSIRDYEFDLIEGAGEAYSEQTANIQRLWENMYTEVASSTTDLAMMFGKSADEINALTMKGIGVEIISGATDNGHSSTWVSPEDLEKHLQQAYSTMGDMLIEDILGDWLKDYQQLEEGLAETGFRVASTNVVIQEFLDYLDYGFKDLAQEVEVSMDLADQAGGLKDFQEAAETFSESFTSEAHRFARSSFQLEKIFEGYNLTLPKTRDAFVDLMGTFDLTTEKGRDTFTSLLTSTEKLDEYYAYLEKVSDKQFEFEAESVRILQGEYASLVLEREKELETLRELNPALVAQQEQVWALQELEKRRDLELEILYLSGDGVNAIAEERKRELEALAPSVRAVQEQVWALEDLQGYQDQQIEILNLLGKEEQATAMERKEALGQLTEVGKQLQMQIYNIEDYIDRTETLANAEDQLAEARDNSTKSIDDLINKLLGSDKSPVQSMEYYESTYSELQDAIANARTPQELTDAVDSFTRFSENYLDYMAAYGGNYRDAFDSTMGILKEAKETASMFSDSVDGSRYFYVENVLTDILGESPSSDQILKWAYSDLEGNTLVSAIVNSLEGGDLRRASTQSYLESMFGSDIYENYKNSLGINLPGYATGGYHTGGWRLVGEQGPELEYTGSSRIYSNSDSTKMIADAIAEALSANNGGGSNMEVKVYLGTREMKDYHVEWHRTDHETHKAVRQEVR